MKPFFWIFLLVLSFSGNATRAATVALVSGEYEYASMITLPAFASYLEKEHGFETIYVERGEGEDIPGIEKVRDADLLILYIRRMTLPDKQLDVVREFIASGKPVLGLRTTSHAFENWKEWDPKVLGGNYHGHHKNELKTTVTVADPDSHPILKNLDSGFVSKGSLYKVSPLSNDTSVLLLGSVALGNIPDEPVAWSRKHGDSQILYTSLGFPEDFEEAFFVGFLVNGVHWLLNLPIPQHRHQGISHFDSRKIDINAFEPLAKHHRTVALDVRTPEEFAAGHVPKAVNLNYSSPSFADEVAKLDRKRPYAVYCKSGGRSARAAKIMKDLGFQYVYDFSGSMNAWQRAGKPLTK